MTSQLLHGERAVMGVRQSWTVVIPTAASAVLALIVIAVAGHLAPATILGHATSKVIAPVVLVAVLIAAAVVLVSVMQWRFATYTLTSHRIIVTRGVVSRVTESISLDRVQNTTVRRSLSQRLIGCGDVEIESAGRDGVELLHRIPNPDAFYNTLMETMEEFRSGGPQAAPSSPSGAV